jgi:Flp pilus assembly protein TadG
MPTRQLPTDQRGVTSAELVIVTPVLLLLVLLVVQVGLYFHASHIALAAAEEGARAARTRLGTAAAGQARARRFAAALGDGLIRSPVVTATRSPATARVEVRGQVATVVPGLRLTVDRVVESPIERFIPESRGFRNSEVASGANPRMVGAGG